MRHQRRVRAVGGALTIAAAGALLWRAGGDAATWRPIAWTLRPLPLVASLLLETAVLAGGVALWRRVLARAAGVRLPYTTLLAAWCRTSLSRYLPGRVWPFLAAELARDPRVPAGVMAATLAAHAALALLASLGVGAAFGARIVDPPALRDAHLAGAAAALAVAAVAVAVVARVGRRRLAAAAAHPVAVAARATLSPRLVLLHASAWIAHGVALFAFAAAVLPAPPPLATLPAIVAAGALAAGAGTLLGLAPAGLGVREATLAALLATRLPAGDAVLLAVAARPWATASELLLGVAALAPRLRRATGTGGAAVARAA